MSSIISNVSTARTTAVNTPLNTNVSGVQAYRFKETFNFAEMELKNSEQLGVLEVDNVLQILSKLFWDILAYGADIAPRGALTDKNIVIEASFNPPQTNKDIPVIYLPIIGLKDRIRNHQSRQRILETILSEELEGYCQIVKKFNNYNDILKLIILASHEFGHYLSYLRGYHDQALKTGLYFMQTHQAGRNFEKYTYQVFSEEATAWRFAKERLEKYNFLEWNNFDKVKESSLREYYRVLGFRKDVSIDVLCKISMLDINLQKISY